MPLTVGASRCRDPADPSFVPAKEHPATALFSNTRTPPRSERDLFAAEFRLWACVAVTVSARRLQSPLRVRQCLEFNGRDRADKCHPGSCSRADSHSRSANCLCGGLDRGHNYRPVRCNQAGSHSMFATQDRSRSHSHKAVAADSTEHSQLRCRRQWPIQSRKPLTIFVVVRMAKLPARYTFTSFLAAESPVKRQAA